MKNLRPVFFILAFLISGSLNAAGKSYKDIQSFVTDKTTQPYIVLGQVAEKARNDEACVKQMAKKAAKRDGDAMINVTNKPTGAKGMFWGESVLHCEAIVVRWAKPGEKGLSSLDPNTPVPFLSK